MAQRPYPRGTGPPRKIRPNQPPGPTRPLTPTGAGLFGSSNLFGQVCSPLRFGFPSFGMPAPGGADPDTAHRVPVVRDPKRGQPQDRQRPDGQLTRPEIAGRDTRRSRHLATQRQFRGRLTAATEQTRSLWKCPATGGSPSLSTIAGRLRGLVPEGIGRYELLADRVDGEADYLQGDSSE